MEESRFIGRVRDVGADTKVVLLSAVQAVVGDGADFDPRLGLTTIRHQFNNTPYRSDRTQPATMLIIHETATANATGRSLNNRHVQRDLPPQNWASWNHIIERDGTVLLYTDQVAWHAGNSIVPRGINRGKGSGVIRAIAWGVELVGKNDGTPATEPQKTSLAKVIRQRELDLGIEFDRENSLFEHAEIAIPQGRKSDSRGVDANEIMRRVVDLRRGGSVPQPIELPLGAYFVNAAVGILRSAPSRGGKRIAGLVRGTRVYVNRWVPGEEVDRGEKRWGDTHPTKDEFMYRNVLKEVPPQTARIALAEAVGSAVGRVEVFAVRRLGEQLSEHIELVGCGGFGDDE